MENFQSGILLILVTILERNLIPLHRLCYSQIIDKPTHFTNSPSSFIDLIFTSNPSIIVDSGIEKSLFSSCHHDIIYGKINFRVPLPPPQFRTIWDYKNADASSIQRAIENFLVKF